MPAGGGANMALCLETKLKAREECTLQLRQTDLDWARPPVLASSRWAMSHSPEYRVC